MPKNKEEVRINDFPTYNEKVKIPGSFFEAKWLNLKENTISIKGDTILMKGLYAHASKIVLTFSTMGYLNLFENVLLVTKKSHNCRSGL